MKAIITRADDFGSSRAANEAILKAVNHGFVKNVSVMACGNYIEEAALIVSDRKDICFGLHCCINSEWDNVTWGPVSPIDKVASLVDKRGVFYQTTEAFKFHIPSIAEIIFECTSQLNYLRKLGFDIVYADFHMFPEIYVSGLQAAMSEWMKREGIIDHGYFNRIFPHNDGVSNETGLFEKVLHNIEGQYLLVLHPARDCEEMKLTGVKAITGEMVAARREKDYQFAINEKTMELCKKYQVKLLRYDEAQKAEMPFVLSLESFR